jgi:SAM-dependent methyltransferase
LTVTSYDAVSYPGYAYEQTHPDRLATQATLFGMTPAPPAACRVLEIGAGDGGNLIPMALGLPGSEFVGIDLAAEPVARGAAAIDELGLGNVTLRVADVLELPADLGQFHYVIAHGVYSWIPPAPRDALMAACGRLLTADGVAYISYNAYPGSYLRDMASDILSFHLELAGAADPAERMARARHLMSLVVAANSRTAYAGVLREHFERVLQHPDALLYHDDLAEINTPVYLHEFVAHAARHGLQFLSEARLHDSQLHELPDAVAAELGRLPDDAVVREQYIDFVVNRMFRQTLLCREDVALDRTLDARRLAGLSFAGALRVERAVGEQPTFVGRGGVSFQPGRPQLSGAVEAIAGAWPQAVSFERLAADLGPTARDRLGSELLEIHAAGVIDLHSHPPAPARVPGPRPVATALARRQAAAGLDRVTSLRHASVRLEDPLAAHLLSLLDGTRDRADLEAAVRQYVDGGGLEGTDVEPPADVARALGGALARLAELSLLVA